jgi:hypothetical protein
MAVSYTKEQEELLRKMRGEGGNANVFPDAYNMRPLIGTTPLVNPQPLTRNPPFSALPFTNPSAALADPYRAVMNPPRVIGPQPAAPSAPTYTSSDSPAGSPRISGKEWLGNLIGPPIDYVRSLLPRPAEVAKAIDNVVPNASKPTPAANTPTAANTPQANPPYQFARAGEIDPTVRNNYNVTTKGDAIKFSNEIGGGEISGLTPKQMARITDRLTNGYRDTNVVPSSFFTGGSAGGSQIPGFDSDTVARLTRAANERVDIGNMRPADAATALSERNYARQQLQQLRAAMAGGANAQAQANAEVQKAIAVEQVRRANPEWKSSDIEVVDPTSPTGVRKAQVLSAPDGRTYQVPDAQDIATLAAAPNDEERARLLQQSGVPDEHIPLYLARFR